MRKNPTVKVKRLADDSVQEMPYKSFQYIKDNIDDVTREKKFELIGWYKVTQGPGGTVTEFVEGDPNQAPQHKTPQAKSVDPVDSVGIESQAEPKKRRRKPADVVLQETQA